MGQARALAAGVLAHRATDAPRHVDVRSCWRLQIKQRKAVQLPPKAPAPHEELRLLLALDLPKPYPWQCVWCYCSLHYLAPPGSVGTVWLPLDHVFLGLDSAPLVAEAWREIARGPQGSIAVSGITQRRPIVENAQLLFHKMDGKCSRQAAIADFDADSVISALRRTSRRPFTGFHRLLTSYPEDCSQCL